MKVKKNTRRFLSTCLVFVLCMSGTILAAEPEQAQTADTVQEAEQTQISDDTSLKVLGEESEEAFRLELTNNTGKDLEYISVLPYDPDPNAANPIFRMQEALIAAGYLDDVADGSAGPKTQAAIAEFRKENGLSEDGGADEEMMEKLLGPGYDQNLLAGDDIFAMGETRVLYLPKPEISSDETGANATEESQDKVVKALAGFSMKPEFVVSFREKGQNQEYRLYVFPADIITKAQLNFSDNIAYIEYAAKGEENPVSALEAEKAVQEALNPPAPVENNSGYDTGYDASYDYGYDTGYPEPAYAEPVNDAPYVVVEEVYPSCDDGSHGVIYRVWSDGREETIEY